MHGAQSVVNSIDELWKLNFEFRGTEPDVTIVIPAYGHHEVTADCLIWLYKTILLNESTCEVLLMDDCSPEPYSKVFGQVQGLKMITNEINLGFLQTCNASLQHALGKDIILLNNDTYPVGKWVDHMRNRKAKVSGSLIIGACLVGLDGLIQESGGIIFSDGSGWNFGRGWKLDDPRCTYAREVDYCSGAAILIDGEFARNKGLFDPEFTPAYYEDTDLCFEARRSGGSVWVEPKAIVIHREGVSHGTSTSSGIKRYQEINREKFVLKWAQELANQFPPSEIFGLRGRTRGDKKRILLIDEEVPRFDAQSGAFRIFSIMQILRDLNYEVSFLPKNGRRADPYTSWLEDIGVEVLGPIDQFWDYVVSIREQLHAVWVSRPLVMGALSDRLQRDLHGVPIIFDMVDLHQLRESRESQIMRSEVLKSESKILEDRCLLSADYVIAVSEEEAEFARQIGSKSVLVVSNVHQVSEIRMFAPTTMSALFVGSFKHTPNADGIIWFLDEVLHQVVEVIPDFCINIVGENPPEYLKQYESDHVKILGWVPDLEPLLFDARLSVSPLRFGAGVKGKISQALSIGLPLVTTSVGAEGMSLCDGVDALICDSSQSFAESVIHLLTDDLLWHRLSNNGQQTAENFYGRKYARHQISQLCELIEKG